MSPLPRHIPLSPIALPLSSISTTFQAIFPGRFFFKRYRSDLTADLRYLNARNANDKIIISVVKHRRPIRGTHQRTRTPQTVLVIGCDARNTRKSNRALRNASENALKQTSMTERLPLSTKITKLNLTTRRQRFPLSAEIAKLNLAAVTTRTCKIY
jgi:hypothetical protein